MKRIHGTTPYDTPKITSLRGAINSDGNTLDEIVRQHRKTERLRIARYTRLLEERRPVYPTPEHRQGIEAVARMVHGNLSYGDHLGYATDEDKTGGTSAAGVSPLLLG